MSERAEDKPLPRHTYIPGAANCRVCEEPRAAHEPPAEPKPQERDEYGMTEAERQAGKTPCGCLYWPGCACPDPRKPLAQPNAAEPKPCECGAHTKCNEPADSACRTHGVGCPAAQPHRSAPPEDEMSIDDMLYQFKQAGRQVLGTAPGTSENWPTPAQPLRDAPQPDRDWLIQNAHIIDVIVRKDGKEYRFDGGFLKTPSAAAPDNAEDRLRAEAHRLRLRVQLGGLSDTEAEALIHAALVRVVAEERERIAVRLEGYSHASRSRNQAELLDVLAKNIRGLKE